MTSNVEFTGGMTFATLCNCHYIRVQCAVRRWTSYAHECPLVMLLLIVESGEVDILELGNVN